MDDRKQEPTAGAPSSDGAGPPDDETGRIEQEIRRRRDWDLAGAVARAGAGNLRGASPVPADRQLVLEAGALLAARLPDPEGTLTRVLLDGLADDPALLAACRGRPAGALAALLDRALATPASLAELVRRVDARWGRDNIERPRFETDGRTAAADDPYTLAGVRQQLEILRQDLAGA
ncbi:hypothetical protein FJ250_09995 [bacterium]|nr:hypothetical protein [bacterium]